MAGRGNNGGDGLAAARHLGRERCAVHLLAEPHPERAPDAALQLRVLRAAGWSVLVGEAPDLAEDLLSVADLERVVVKSVAGTPVYLSQVAEVQIGGEIRRGLATMDGKGETVAGMILSEVPPGFWLGWSLGGLVATRAALQAPERVDALVTMASTPCFVRRPGWQSAMLPELLDTFSAELEQDYARTLGRFLALQVRGSEQASVVLGELRNILLAHGEPNAQALATGLAILRDTDLRDTMRALRMRLLMIMGERDTLVPVNAGRETLALCGDAQLEVIDGAGHAPFLAAPERVAERIDRFLGESVGTAVR